MLWISDSPRFTGIGQSRVTREVCNRWHKKFYDVEVGGWGEGLPNLLVLQEKLDYPVHPLDRKDPGKTIALIEKVKPNFVVLSHDTWMFPNIAEAKLKHQDTTFVGYITIDSGPPTPAWRGWLATYDGLVVPAQYGRDMIESRWFDLRPAVVPYGVDRKYFHPAVDGKPKLKESVYNESYRMVREGKALQFIDVRGRFTASYLGMNSSRKNVLSLVEAWRKFEVGKTDDVALLLLCHTIALQVEDVGHYPISEFVKGETILYFPQPLPEDMCGSIIALSDVLLHPSLGEGFGLPILEAMSCGTVPIVTDYAAMHDLCKSDFAYMLDCVPYAPHGTLHVCVPDVDDIVLALEEAFADWKSGKLAEKSKRAAEEAKKYPWDNTAWKLKEVLDEAEKVKEKRKTGIIATRIV